MKTRVYIGLCTAALLLAGCQQPPKEEPIEAVIERGLQTATEQAIRMAESLENRPGLLPKSIDKGALETSDYAW